MHFVSLDLCNWFDFLSHFFCYIIFVDDYFLLVRHFKLIVFICFNCFILLLLLFFLFVCCLLCTTFDSNFSKLWWNCFFLLPVCVILFRLRANNWLCAQMLLFSYGGYIWEVILHLVPLFSFFFSFFFCFWPTLHHLSFVVVDPSKMLPKLNMLGHLVFKSTIHSNI